MDLHRAFALSSHALVLTGAFAFALAESQPLTLAIATLFTVLAYIRAESQKRPVGRLLTNLLVFATLFACPVIWGATVDTLAYFLLIVQIVKLFGVKAPRDHVQIFLISLVLLGVAAILTIDLIFSVAFVAYIVIATWTLILFTLVAELDSRKIDTRSGEATFRFGRRLTAGITIVTLGTMAFTTVLFLVFPRISAVVFHFQRGSTTPRLSGFSDDIRLTDLSAIHENQEDVMRVQPEKDSGPMPSFPKWRGLAFDRYEDGHWKRSWQRPGSSGVSEVQPNPNVATQFSLDRLTGAKKYLFRRGDDGEDDTLVKYSVLLEPTGTDALFALVRPRVVEFQSAGQPSGVVLDSGDGIRAYGLPSNTVRYRAETVVVRREAARAAPDATTGWVDRVNWLMAPEGGIHIDRLKTLADSIVAKARARTPLERADALEAALRDTYKYTLDLVAAPEGTDPIEDFLFTQKVGHCELFASAFVLMARTQNLPARLVNGFQCGEWNAWGEGYWQVRQSDAHAWAEVYFEGAGWVDFDPTPPGSNPHDAGFFSKMRQFQDYLKMRWLSYVISYNLSDQISFADKLRNKLGSMREYMGHWFEGYSNSFDLRRNSGRSVSTILGVAAVLGGVVAVVYFRSRKKRRDGSGGRRAQTVEFYEELLRLLAARGWKRLPFETPREFAARVAADGGRALFPAADVVEAFYGVRFGGAALAEGDETKVREALESLRALPRGRRRAAGAIPSIRA